MSDTDNLGTCDDPEEGMDPHLQAYDCENWIESRLMSDTDNKGSAVTGDTDRCPHVVSSDDGTSHCALAEAEVVRLQAEVSALQGTLIDNTHALRTALYGHSSAEGATPKEVWERTLADVLALRTRGRPV